MVGADGVIRGPAGEGRVGAVSRDDVADVAVAVVLGGAEHDGRTYDATGPEVITLHEAAEELTPDLLWLIVGGQKEDQDLQDRTKVLDDYHTAPASAASTIDARERKSIPIIRSNLDFCSRGDPASPNPGPA